MDQKLLITKLKDIYIMMNSFVYTLTMDDYEKDDIVQSAMEIIYEKCHQLKDDDKLLDWAFMITKNVAKKYFNGWNGIWYYFCYCIL